MSNLKQLIRVVPYRTPEVKDQVVTCRFTELEKEYIDTKVEEYGTTLTDFVRNAVFYYVKVLEKEEEGNQ